MRVLAIARLTLLELRHSKLLVLPLSVAAAIAVVAYNVKDPALFGDELLRGMWRGQAVAGGLVAILAASGALATEIERGTMLLLAVRPISRTGIVLGKAIGVTTYLLLCSLAWSSIVAIGIGRYVHAGWEAAFVGSLLSVMSALLVATVALAASAAFPTRGAIGATLALCLAAAFVAAIPLETVSPEHVARVRDTQHVMATVLPVDRLMRLSDLALGHHIGGAPFWSIAAIGAWFVLALAMMRLRGNLAR